jgi:hypothetical protein
MKPEQTRFLPAWLSFDLGEYRPCNDTYCSYDLSKTPPLPSDLFKGNFDWLPKMSIEMKELMAKYQQNESEEIEAAIQAILRQAKSFNLSLPPEFIQFMRLEDLQSQIPSCTACYFDLSTDIIPCPLSHDEGYLIRFMNDQQAVLLWYLYIRPDGGHCVVVSPIPFDNAKARGQLDDSVILDNTFFCAESFEEFVYRFWLENEIWFAIEDEATLTPSQQAYLDFYK